MKIQIATAKTRKATLWTNRKMEWQDFATRLATRYDTQESFAEYQAMTKAEKGDIKDVGGFVGGFLFDGKRKKGNVKYRSLLCLDLDNCDESTRDKIHHALERYQYVYYTTHSHSVEAPKFRVVIPLLDKIADPIKYEALGRFFASQIDIETIDRSTFEMERLMYYPSCSYDAEFLSHFNSNGEFVNHEYILANAYDDYTDAGSWAYSSLEQSSGINFSKAEEEYAGKGKLLADPRKKDNLVGVFCRAYDVHEAILRYLPDVYRKEDHNHYTYINGSSTRGLVVLDFGKVAYSHHSTDPVHGKAVNAFDLVRLHKFGYLDEGATVENFKDLPSMKEMTKLLENEGIISEKMTKIAEDDFADLKNDKDLNLEKETKEKKEEEEKKDKEDPNAHYKDLKLTAKGKFDETAENLDIIMSRNIRISGNIYFDEFTGKKMIRLDNDWKGYHKNENGEKEARLWNDNDDAHIFGYIETAYGIKNRAKILDALARFSTKNRSNPIKEFIKKEIWDGKKRVETLFIDYLGAEDNIINRTLARKVLSACVARIFSPGIKYDQITVFVGREGLGKSTFLKALGQNWFNDSFFTVEGKEAMSQLSGSWIIEIAELQGLKKAEMTAIKAFISKQKDNFREAYARNSVERARQCVFFATTNESNFLKNENGNRRFWIVEAGVQQATKSPFDLVADSKEVQQIMAEALCIWKSGEKLYLSKEEEAKIKEVQERFEIVDERVGLIEEYLRTPIPRDWDKKSKEERAAYYKMLNQFNAEASGTHANAVADYFNTGYLSSNYRLREYITPAEIKVECLGLNLNSPQKQRDTQEIKQMLKHIKSIEVKEINKQKRVNGYGPQNCYYVISLNNNSILS